MNKISECVKSRDFRKKFLKGMCIYTVVFAAVLVVGLAVGQEIVWYKGDLFYDVFSLIRGFLLLVLIEAWLVGAGILFLVMALHKGKNKTVSHIVQRFRQRTLSNYFITLVLYTAGLISLVIVSRVVIMGINWDVYSLLYRLFLFAERHIEGIFLIAWLLGFIIISVRLVYRLTGYLDKTAEATKGLLSDPAKPVTLPDGIKGLQDDINGVRERFLESARLAKEAEQRKNDLIVYLAHDLKTPLTSVIGYLTLLKDEPDISPATRAKYTGIALDKAMRLEELINEFFDVTRFNLTAMTLQKERISLSRMLEQLVDEFTPVLAQQSLSWDAEIESDIQLFCDPDKLERVFDNLIRNAANYSYKNTKISLTLKNDQNKAVITVKNHGQTIPPEKLEKIFQQFFRIDSARSTSTGGAGLGLAIAKEIVDLHGGKIFAESANESIFFTVILPLEIT